MKLLFMNYPIWTVWHLCLWWTQVLWKRLECQKQLTVCFRHCSLGRSAGPCSAASSSEELLLYVFCMLVRLDSQNTAAFLLSGSVEGISQDSWHDCPCLHALLCSDEPDLRASSMGDRRGSGDWKESLPWYSQTISVDLKLK